MKKENSKSLILDGLAKLVSPSRVTRTLPQDTLKEIYSIVNKAKRYHGRWLVLLTGPDGTGKTLAAEAMATETGLSLYRVDLGLLVSKYVGETEKNLNAMLDGAAKMDCALLFDEADSLFGKSRDIHDTNQNYENFNLNDLLKGIETYKGLIIISVNDKESLAPIFMQKTNFIINMEKPNPSK